MTASNDSDPHRKNGADNLKIRFLRHNLRPLRAAGYAFFSAKSAYSAQNKRLCHNKWLIFDEK